AGVRISDDEYTLLYGPVLARLFLDRGPVTDAFIDAVVSQWLTTLQRAGAPQPNDGGGPTGI
ncbi:TetR/AcrR family transcriptional regulator C-terminal ligand-binding domain-containing protein, partial [Nonomuraea diastatica]